MNQETIDFLSRRIAAKVLAELDGELSGMVVLDMHFRAFEKPDDDDEECSQAEVNCAFHAVRGGVRVVFNAGEKP